MANEKIEDVIKKVILGEGFLSNAADGAVHPDDNEDTSNEEICEDEEELEEAKNEEADEEESDEDEEEADEEESDESDEDEEAAEGKKKIPAFLKGKFGKKKEEKTEKVEEAASDYASEKMYKTANGKSAKIAEPTGDASGKNQGTIKAKASSASGKIETPKAVKEEIAAMFVGQELSEEFKSQAATLFEAHINERVHQIEEQLKEQYEDLLEQHTVAVTEELVERIDDYLNYVVEEWMQENRLAVEKGLRTEITENFITNLRGLFAESYIEVPEEKLDLFESTVEKVEALGGELKGQVDKNIELNEEVEQLKCEIVFRDIAEGLTDTDSEKLRRLAEDLEFDTVEQFAEKLGVLRKNIETIGNPVTEGEAKEESLEESYEDASEASPLIEAFARSMSKSRE